MAAVTRVLPRHWDGRRLLRFLTGLAMLALAFTVPAPREPVTLAASPAPLPAVRGEAAPAAVPAPAVAAPVVAAPAPVVESALAAVEPAPVAALGAAAPADGAKPATRAASTYFSGEAAWRSADGLAGVLIGAAAVVLLLGAAQRVRPVRGPPLR
ncbi:hypothetical protein AB0J83_43610 [Actinoplanes sp. NPDC049596]|uniref:hypothetical protein n=1 Tax=unclassified Actinoplanes TaxID=2626549 RepID=UPI00343B1964